jgi:hypothetical protein
MKKKEKIKPRKKMNNNYYYFEGCEYQKMQWLSIFLQCYLVSLKDKEIDEKELFIKANMAWYNINKLEALSYDEFQLILDKIIQYKMVFNLSISPSKKLLLALKQCLLTPVRQL